MAFIIRRRGGGYEIRESIHTPGGPKSRTLATFRALDDAVLDHADRRAWRPLNRDELRRRARVLGAPIRGASAIDGACRQVLEKLRSGEVPGVVLATLLQDELRGREAVLPDSIASCAEWLGVSPAQRGHALRDLLHIVDRFPVRERKGTISFPRINTVR